MHSAVRRADLSGQLLVVVIYRLRAEVRAGQSGKYQGCLSFLRILPPRPHSTCLEPLRCLLPPSAGQQRHDRGSGLDDPGLVVLQRGEGKAAVRQGPLLELLADRDRPGLEVDAVPCQADSLRFPKAGKQDHFQEDLVFIGGRHPEEVPYLFVRQRLDVLLDHFRERDRCGGIVPQVSHLYCGRQALCQDAVDIADALSGEAGPLEAVVKGLYLRRGQLR